MNHTLTHYRARLALVATLLAGLTAAGAAAAEFAELREPVASRNLSPVYANLGIPVMQSAFARSAGQWSAGWNLHWASHSVQESARGRDLEYDGETQRHDLRVTGGIGNRLTLSVNVPWIRHTGGSLDSLIDGWHDFWGMPDGARPDQPRDQLLFGYSGVPGFLLDDDASGVGDVEIGLAATLLTRDSWALAAFAQAKLDTGDVDDFTGSGDYGYSGGLRFSAERCLWASLSCHAQLGISDVGSLPWAPAADSQALFGGFSLAWAFMPNLALVAQLDVQDEVYVSAPLAAGGTPVWGTLGVRWQWGERWLFDAQFSEDLAVDTAADITFLLGVRRSFR